MSTVGGQREALVLDTSGRSIPIIGRAFLTLQFKDKERFISIRQYRRTEVIRLRFICQMWTRNRGVGGFCPTK